MTDSGSIRRSDLWQTIREGNNIALASLIAAGQDVNARDSEGQTPLITAIFFNNLEAVELIIKAGANPNLPNGAGHPPLYHAARQGRIAMTAQLLAAGADPIAVAKEGLHTLFKATGHLTGSLRERIAESPAIRETLEMTDDYGVTPLMSMVERGNLLVVEQMLDMGADMEAIDRDLNTALHRAARGYSADIAALLLQRGARMDATNVDGKTPLDLACEPGATPAVRDVFQSYAITGGLDNSPGAGG